MKYKILYPAFVRAHLEFALAVWNLMSKKNKSKLEGVQKKATKMFIELRVLEYEERWEQLRLTSLKIRRIRENLIQIYKITKGFKEVGLGLRNTWGTEGANRRHNSQHF